MNLSGNRILVTGGSSGIGMALAERLLKLGNKVVICGRREDALRVVKNRLKDIHVMVSDTGSETSRVELFEKATREHPDLNILINNAGIQRQVSLNSLEPWKDIQQEIAVNLEGPIHLSMLFIPHLLKQRSSWIMNVSSGLAFMPLTTVPVYCATKAGLHSFTQSLRHQLRKTNIGVVEIIPPAVRTNLGGSHDFGAPLGEYADSVIEQLKDGRIETTFQMSAKSSQASRAELDQMFSGMNSAHY